jgi:bacterioferritin
MALLKQNLDSERCAIARYQQICDMCFGKDYETFDISLKIMHDELDHEQDWEDFIKDLQDSSIFYGENA